MKTIKYIPHILFFFFASISFAQTDLSKAKVITASQTISNSNGFSIITGRPYLGIKENNENSTNPQIRFPWDVLYLYETFNNDSFDVSKGQFTDKVRINWVLRNNIGLIDYIYIYRRKLSNIERPYELVASVASNETEYEDFYVEGNVLYEYRVEAVGILNESIEYQTYIDGVGFRLPTAITSGNVSFEGNTPVRNVSVYAIPTNGGFSNTGSVIRVNDDSWFEVNYINQPITNKLTYQAWVKPSTPFSSEADPALHIFELKNNINAITKGVNVKLQENSEGAYLEINIDGSIYKVYNYIPSGELNARGGDLLVPVSEFNTRYTHITAVMQQNQVPVLYINGRKIDENYKTTAHNIALDTDANYTAPYFNIELLTNVTNFDLQNNGEWISIASGGKQSKSFFTEEFRIWNDVIDDETILLDYRRYISGNDSRLVCYLKFDEGVGRKAYDYSYTGFTHNNNHAEFDIEDFTSNTQGTSWVNSPGDLPEEDQLGFFGVTNSNGNYVINAIPYSGTGQSFDITPVLGVHKFQPNQQSVFLGVSNSVANQINFTDISSFTFRGRVLYDTRNVFKSFVEVNSGDSDAPVFNNLSEGDEYVSGPGIIDENYNYYRKDGVKYAKGEYWLNNAGTPDDANDDYLERYARVASEGVNIFIDGQIALDANNTPIASDSQGNFEIQVPIGDHYITVAKDGHEFVYNGRFPANPSGLTEFYEDDDEAVIFVDNTRVSLVGRVVGGIVESEKPIGFGNNGLYTTEIVENEISQTVEISSVNNIGTANITLGYTPPSGSITNYTRFNFDTNEESGEYRVNLLPLNYSISQTNGLRIINNSEINLLDANEILNLTSIIEKTTPIYESAVSEITGEPYHYEKSFTYRSTPVLRVTEQNAEAEVSFDDGTTISTEGFSHLIYRQFRNYEINLLRIESYVNYDTNPEVEYTVPLTDGELNITNNAALDNSESIEIDTEDPSKITYSFRGGLPSISAPYTRSIDIKYHINGVQYEAESYESEIILLGGQSDGSQTFITAAPDVPDIILRDPPGSNSFATIESGESISFTTKTDFTNAGGISTNLKLLLGIEFKVGGGLAGPVISSTATNSPSVGIGVSSSSTEGKELTKTYTFSQAISTTTDPDPDMVGLSDLYIGQSKNYFYGTYDDVDFMQESNGGDDEVVLTNTNGETLYINKQKAIYVSEEPSDTFFVYSQRFILGTLIPELERFVESIENGVLSEDDPGVLTKKEYQQQINLWRSTIRENERIKYIAKNDRTAYKEQLENNVNAYINEISNVLAAGNDPASEAILISRLNNSNSLKQAIANNFESNISLDAGVGEISRTIQTSVVSSTTKTINFNTEESFALELGYALNTFGLLSTTSTSISQDINTELTENEENLTTITYTLSDNDMFNTLSVDIINPFDGNGPIFSLIGGLTSCPYIGEDLSLFYNNDSYDSNDQNIQELAENEREILANGTQQVERPEITVNVSELRNIPETANAEFTLTLKNTSASESDAALALFVNPATNPNNAIINIAEQGLVFVDLPYNEPVEYQLTVGKSISDIYSYEDIEIVFVSDCSRTEDGDRVTVSAHFVPSCSNVTVSSPLENWVYNVDEAFNVDGTTNNLPIELSEYDLNFNSFQKIDLQYRQVSSPTWTRLHTYYSTQDFYDDAVSNNESGISLIGGSTVTYQWDILQQGIQNGEYEIRAISTCTNNTDFISDPIRGIIDISAPVVFGTPSPTDGILSHGEDIKVRFNEDILYNSAVSLIEIKGRTNQLPINSDVSVFFNGINNTAIIESPYINTGSFAFEFWMKNGTTSAEATIVSQEDGFAIRLQNNTIVFDFGDYSANGVFTNDDLFHHYTFTYHADNGELSIFEDGNVVNTATAPVNLVYSFTDSITLGGNTFTGNIHDVRLWSKELNLTDSFANIYTQFLGNEPNLTGYWPMNEGRGNITRDLARFKHMQLNNAEWDIRPKGTSYEFAANQFLTLDNVNFVNLTDGMDFTLSFWVKTDQNQAATLFSNGRGDGTDVVLADGTYNKWAVNLTLDGNITLDSEGNTYQLTKTAVTDNAWHHVAVLMNRQGNLNTYIDANLVTSLPSSEIKGFSSDRIWVGARGHSDLFGERTVDQNFSGNLDEIRLWSSLRSVDQISRDRYNEVDFNSTGLLLYLKMNQPDPPTGNGPRYYHVTNNLQTTNSLTVINRGSVNYSQDTPPIKPERQLVNFQVQHVINGDEMILDPVVTSYASIEGQQLDITVHRMFDNANNIQQSPITWSAFVNKNQVSWSIEGETNVISASLIGREEKTLQIIVKNDGGTVQPFNITNIPSWLSLSQTSGNILPSSVATITAIIDPQLGFGYFEHDLFLETDFGFDQKIQLHVEVLPSGPNWVVAPEDYDFSLNIIGKVKINNIFSENTNNRIAAFVNGELRGVTNLVYDPDYQSHYAFLTIYSNSTSGEDITFSIWDSSTDIIHSATIGGEGTLAFIDNSVLGSKSIPEVFENTQFIEQTIPLNSGWTWVSFFLEDNDFSDINALTQDLQLELSDRILSHAPSYLEVFDNGSWSGSLVANGGLSNDKMYKIRLANQQNLNLIGVKVDLSTWSFNIKENWNWLPYVITKNTSLNDAIANFNPTDGDVIKSQNKFAIYDPLSGWSGSLTSLEPGKGYMLRSSIEQTFSYPVHLEDTFNRTNGSDDIASGNQEINDEFLKYQSNMNAIVQLPEGYTTLYAYDKDDNLRGVVNTQRVNNKELCFITIFGNSSEELIFHIGNDNKQKTTSKRVIYRNDDILGTILNPIIIKEDIDENKLKVYPNPFDENINIKFSSSKDGHFNIEIHDVLGKTLFNKKMEVTLGTNNFNFDFYAPSGIYFMKIKTNNESIVKKIIKK